MHTRRFDGAGGSDGHGMAKGDATMTQFTGFGRGLVGWRGILIMAFAASVLVAGNASADLIRFTAVSGDPDNVSGASALLGHSGDNHDYGYWFQVQNPPWGSGEGIRPFSERVNIEYNLDGYEQHIDSPPFDSNPNLSYPLGLDTQGTSESSTITSSNNFTRFVLEEGPDIAQGRRFMLFEKTLYNGATFLDGSTSWSGVWDLSASATYDLPAYNLAGTHGRYAEITATPSAIPEPSTLLLLIGTGGALMLRRKLMNPRSGRRV